MDDKTERALAALRDTDRPIDEIAESLGLTREAMDRRLERAYGQRSREIRTGQGPTPGRPPADEPRTTWTVRLTARERRDLDAALARERKAGAERDGEALLRIVRRANERKPPRS